ncbi:MAG: peptidylprolyl isomerase [Planctomycetota bacterium]|nr:MAG: peptidylprolyl isomerase [Planctomycetota bacterium]
MSNDTQNETQNETRAETIGKDSVVHIDYTLRNDAGEVIDKSAEGKPLPYLHGHGQIVPGLEKALEGKAVGESFSVTIPAAEGYGERSEEAIFEIPRDRLPEGLEPQVGMELAAQSPDGQVLRFRLIEIGEDTVKADANHPLAGQDLHFDITVAKIRPATSEEIAHGHAH